MKKSNLITEISLQDFLKLDLYAYEHRVHFYNKDGKEIHYEATGTWMKDNQGDPHWVPFDGCYSKNLWDKVSLNEIVKENISFSEKEKFENHCICVAIHTEPSEEEIEKEFEELKCRFPNSRWTLEDMRSKFLFEYSYLDKWLTRAGNQTYLIRCDVPHLYSEKRKFCTHDDYFEIPKNQTKAVYLIYY